MGPFFFTLAIVGIIVAPLVGLIWGPARVIAYRLRGLDLAPPIDLGRQPISADALVETSVPSLLTQRPKKGGLSDPCVCVQGADYRVTRVGESRYLVTERRESRRLGFFELVADADHAQIVPEPDEPANKLLLVRIALEASRTRA